MQNPSPTRTFVLTDEHRKALIDKAIEAFPEEACGFILSDGRLIEVENSHPYPYKGFQMSPKALWDKLTDDDIELIVAIWHTHPRGSTQPSATDIEAMVKGQFGWQYLIATKTEVAQYDSEFFIRKPLGFWNDFRI